MLWELLFSLFGVNWIILGLVRDMLLGWKGTFVRKRRKKVWQVAPSCLFWTVWKARNRIVFKEDVLSIHKLKYLFLFLLWSETKLSIENSPSTLDGFIDWVSCKWFRGCFCLGFFCWGVNFFYLVLTLRRNFSALS